MFTPLKTETTPILELTLKFVFTAPDYIRKKSYCKTELFLINFI